MVRPGEGGWFMSPPLGVRAKLFVGEAILPETGPGKTPTQSLSFQHLGFTQDCIFNNLECVNKMGRPDIPTACFPFLKNVSIHENAVQSCDNENRTKIHARASQATSGYTVSSPVIMTEKN